MDDFGFKYMPETDTNYSLQLLQSNYTITVEKGNPRFCGLHLEWNYNQRCVDISMPHYAQKILKIRHPTPRKEQHTMYTYILKSYDATEHLTLSGGTILILSTTTTNIYNKLQYVSCARHRL